MRNTFLLLSLLLFLSACGNQASAPAQAEENDKETPAAAPAEPAAVVATPALNIGDKAPDFELTATDGKSYSLADFTAADGSPAKGYVVTFTCNTCPYAQKYEDRLVELHERTAAKGYPVVAIQPNDTEIKPGDNKEAMQARSSEKNFPFAYLLDEGQQVYPTYGASRTPEIFLLGADRTLHYHGAIDDDVEGENVSVNYVDAAIAALEAGQAADPQNVKAVGCTIKAK